MSITCSASRALKRNSISDFYTAFKWLQEAYGCVGRVLVVRPEKRNSLVPYFVLNEDASLVWYRDFFHYVHHIPLNWNRSVREMDPVHLLEYLFKRVHEGIVGQYADGLLRINIIDVLNKISF